MTITTNAYTLDWQTNMAGRWSCVLDDIAPDTQSITFSEGYTPTVTGRKVTLTNTERPKGTVTYATSATDTVSVYGLYKAGTVKDDVDAITGEGNRRIGSYTFTGNEVWSAYTGYSADGWTTTAISDKQYGSNVLLIGYTTIQSVSSLSNYSYAVCGDSEDESIYICDADYPSSTVTPSAFADHMAGKTIYYELATPTAISDDPQTLPLKTGLNITSAMASTDGGSYTLSYDGTDYSIATKSARKYLKRIDGTDSIVTGVTSIEVKGGRDMVIDLTRMFGSALEPSTTTDFYGLFPAWMGYAIPYNPGELLNYKGTGLKSVGFNQFSGVYSEEGKYLTSTGTLTVGTDYNVTDYLRAVPGQTYRLTAYGNAPSICWYTYGKTFISGTAYGHASTWQEDVFTAPANAYWVRFSVYMPRVNETCFYFQWSGPRNGDYEPYWTYTRQLPTLECFPDGMNGRGSVYDEINERSYVKRFGKVDLGTLTWTHSDAYGLPGIWTSSAGPSDIKKPASTNSTGDITMVSSDYMLVSASSLAANSNGAGNFAIHTNGQVKVNNGSSTVSPTGWLVYELAAPVVTNFSEPPNMTAQISDFGTEESLPANGYVPTTAPFNGLVLYAADYARTITKLPENYISKESMEAFLAMVGPLLNGEVTMTYNASTGEYSFNFTPNA